MLSSLSSSAHQNRPCGLSRRPLHVANTTFRASLNKSSTWNRSIQSYTQVLELSGIGTSDGLARHLGLNLLVNILEFALNVYGTPPFAGIFKGSVESLSGIYHRRATCFAC
jgi:hypothetical protein